MVRIRPPESGPGQHDTGVFPAVGAPDTIVVDRDGSETRYDHMCVVGDHTDSSTVALSIVSVFFCVVCLSVR